MINMHQKMTQTLNQQQDAIGNLQKQIVPSRKHSRMKIDDEYDYEREKKFIPGQSTNKWRNRVVYDLMSEADCYKFTGFSRSTIIDQAEIAGVIPECCFHLRHFIYAYPTRELHAQTFGWTRKTLSLVVDETLAKMSRYYAKPVLLNDNPSDEQYWSKSLIHDNTPDYVFRLRQIDKDDEKCPNVVTVDSTYQYTQQVQTDQDIRKKQLNIHKYSTLIKIHLWACTNGAPIYAQYMFSDGYHGDGKIFAASLNEAHVKKCKLAIETGKLDDTHSFRKLKIVKELQNLQKLIDFHTHVICDNGYRLRDGHPCLKMPGQAPASDDQDGQVTPLAAAHKRGIMAVRNGHERINGWCKRNKFCRTTIAAEDIPRVPDIWNMVLADMIYGDIQLSKDDMNSGELCDRIMDMMHVAINPMDAFWNDNQSNKKSKKVKKSINDGPMPSGQPTEAWGMKHIREYITKHQLNVVTAGAGRTKSAVIEAISQTQTSNDMEIDNDDNDDNEDPDFPTSDEDEDEDEITDPDFPTSEFTTESDTASDTESKTETERKTAPATADDSETHASDEWLTVAIGWNAMVQYIKSGKQFQHIRDLWSAISHLDVYNYIGKDWERRKAKAYLRRLNYELESFKLKQSRKNKYIFMWENIKSKYRSSKKYIVLMSFFQMHLFKESHRKLLGEEVELDDQDLHWYRHLIQDGEEPVSAFLSEKYVTIQDYLEKRRKNRMRKRRKLYYGNLNVGRMRKDDLLYFAQEHNIDLPQKMVKKESIVKYVINELRERKIKEWRDKSQVCAIDGCNKKADKRCSRCKATFYCSECVEKGNVKEYWFAKHRNECQRLKNTNYIQKTEDEIGDSISLFEPMDKIERIRQGAQIADSLNYMKQYPLNQKSWYDLDLLYSTQR